MEAAVALQEAGAEVALSYRGPELSRAKPENVEALNASGAEVIYKSTVLRIDDDAVTLKTKDGDVALPNDAVFH